MIRILEAKGKIQITSERLDKKRIDGLCND
jgi:hypothetical protein